MKKIGLFLVLILMFHLFSLYAAADEAAAAPTLTVDSVEVAEGTEKFTVTVSMSNAPDLTVISLINWKYDTEKITYIEAESNVKNTFINNIKDNGNLTVAMNKDTDINGRIATYTFALHEGVKAGALDLTCTIIIKTKVTGVETDITEAFTFVPGKVTVVHTGGIANCQDLAVCEKCGESYGTVDANNHKSLVEDDAVAPTCTATGLTAGKHCSVCGEKLIAQEAVEKLPHTEAIDAAVAATCTETGLTAGWHCAVCKKVLIAQEVVPVRGHVYEEVVIAAACTVKGSTTYTCHCGHSYAVYTDATGHKDDNEDNICDNCGVVVGVVAPPYSFNTPTEEEGEDALENITNIAPDTKVEDFAAAVGAADVKVYDEEGKELEEGTPVGTGCEVKLFDDEGNEIGSYTAIVTSDVDGDGAVTAADARSALRNSVALEELTEAQKRAADLDGDGQITSADARYALRLSVGLEDAAGFMK